MLVDPRCDGIRELRTRVRSLGDMKSDKEWKGAKNENL